MEDIVAAFAWIEEKFGGTDVLVNNAGLFLPGHITGEFINMLVALVFYISRNKNISIKTSSPILSL